MSVEEKDKMRDRDPLMKAVKEAGKSLQMEELFREIFVETSSGDIGVQIKNGPQLRVHSAVLATTPGFLGSLRMLCKPLPIYVQKDNLKIRHWFRKKGINRIADEIQFSSFAIDEMSKPYEQPYLGGYTTADTNSGTTGALQRRDPLRLAERYQMDEAPERVVELFRFLYIGRVDYFWMEPTTSDAKRKLLDNMLQMLFLATRMAVDELFGVLIRWFPLKCRQVCGDECFADGFYRIEYYLRNSVEEPLHQRLMMNALLEIACERQNLMLLSWDQRWTSLDPFLLEPLFHQDHLGLVNEGELLSLVERWNANRDKEADEILKLVQCFRQTARNLDQLIMFLTSMGLINVMSESQEPQGESKKGISAERRRKGIMKQLVKLVAPNTKPIRSQKNPKLRKKSTMIKKKSGGDHNEAEAEAAEEIANGKPILDPEDALRESEGQSEANLLGLLEASANEAGALEDDDEELDLFVQVRKLTKDNATRAQLRELMQAELKAKEKKKQQDAYFGRESSSSSHGSSNGGGSRETDFSKFIVIRKALAFTLETNDSLVQRKEIKTPGNYRIRVALTQKVERLWNTEHDVFIGILYGTNRFFGYMASQSPYLGIFQLRCVSAVANKAEKPVYISGSGQKMEFDVDLVIGMEQVHGSISCKTAILANNTFITRNEFECNHKTLKDRGLRFQIVPIGQQKDDQIDIRLTWTMSGTANVV